MMNGHGLLFVAFMATSILHTPAVAQDRGVEGVENPFPTTDFGTYRAVIIGIDDYGSWQDLEFAEQDARELGEILVDHYGFDPEKVVMLLGSDATESKIMRGLRDVLETAGESDNVLIFYAGHGQWAPFDETGYWIPVDGDVSNDRTWISFRDVVALIEADRGRAKKVVVITDSCYGGALLSTRSGRTPGFGEPSDNYELYLEQLRDVANAHSRQVISSGGNEPVPDRSLFARLLKKALRENTYPYVDLRFLLNRKIQAQWPIQEGAPRLADLGEQRGEFVFVRSGEVVDLPSPGDVVDAHLPSLAGEVELAFWNSIQGGDNPELYREYIRRFPDGHFVVIARDRLQTLEHIVVPELAGMNTQEAEQALQNVGLAVGAITSRDSTSPRGTVLDQVPTAESRVKRGTTVELTVATWPSVPDVVGRSVAEAVETLTSQGFQIQRSYATARAIAEAQKLGRGRPGTVITQQPGADDEAQPRAEVTLFVAGSIVPKLAGLHEKDAYAMLEKVGLKLGESNKIDATETRPGTVLEQSPQPGTVLAPGLAVDVTVARGVVVPNLLGLNVKVAATVLEKARLSLGNTKTAAVKSRRETGIVLNQSIAAGNVVAPGTAVAVTYGEASEQSSRPDPESACTDLVQGKIAWDYEGTKRWDASNVNRLCRATSRPAEPGRCFDRVMHGGIDWGGGTRWEWKNALDLCEGTDNATRTIDCFQEGIRRGSRWQDAIRSCGK